MSKETFSGTVPLNHVSLIKTHALNTEHTECIKFQSEYSGGELELERIKLEDRRYHREYFIGLREALTPSPSSLMAKGPLFLVSK